MFIRAHASYVTGLILFCLCTAAFAATPAEAALEEANRNYLKPWSFKAQLNNVTQGEKKLVTYHYDAQAPEGKRFVLDLQNGATPSKEEQTKWESNSNKDAEANKRDRAPAELVDVSTLKPIGTDGKRWSFAVKSLKVLGPMEQFIKPGQLTGELQLDEQGALRTLKVSNPESFRIMLVYKVEQVLIEWQFARQTDRTILPARYRFVAKAGSNFDADITRTYSDWQLPGTKVAGN